MESELEIELNWDSAKPYSDQPWEFSLGSAEAPTTSLKRSSPPQSPNPRRRRAWTARWRSAGPPSTSRSSSSGRWPPPRIRWRWLDTAPSPTSSSPAGGRFFPPVAPTRRSSGLCFELAVESVVLLLNIWIFSQSYLIKAVWWCGSLLCAILLSPCSIHMVHLIFICYL